MRREVPQAPQTVSEMMVYVGGASSDVDRDDADADVPEAEWSLQTSSPLVAQRWTGGTPPNDPPTICDMRGCWCVWVGTWRCQ
jgi:hypothetical protein